MKFSAFTIISGLAFLWLCAALIVSWTGIGGLFGGLITYFPPLMWAFPALCTVGWFLLLAVRRKASRELAVLAGLNVVATGLLCGINVPLTTPESGTGFRVMTFNVHYESRVVPKVLELVQNEKPDIIFLQENKGGNTSPATYLANNLPGWAMEQAGDVAILSRWPLSDVKSWPLHSVPDRVILSAMTGGENPVRVMTTHWSVPQWRLGMEGLRRTTAAQKRDFDDTMQAVAECSGPIILGGDFNNPPPHEFTRTMSAQMTNAFSKVGRGTGYTFPRRIAVVRIDHLYSSRELEPVTAWVGPTAGSDHRSLFADYRWMAGR